MDVKTRECPFCMSTIPAAARKCKHCGEWVSGRRSQPAPASNELLGDSGLVTQFFKGETFDETMNAGVKAYAKWKIYSGIAGLIIFLIFFLGVWLPQYNAIQNDRVFPSGGCSHKVGNGPWEPC
jgi:hypothetical protein